MPDVITPNLNLVKPEPGASENTWGEKLNSNFDLIDSFALTTVRTTGVQTINGNEFRLRGTSGAQATPGLNFATGVGIGWNVGVGLALISGGVRRMIVDDTNQRVTVTGDYAFGGDGSGLTNLPAASLTGTIADARLPSNVLRTSGNGLTNSGNTVSMGTPSSITHNSENGTSPTSHTHAISNETVRLLIAPSPENLPGTYAFARKNTAGDVVFGTVLAGSALTVASTGGAGVGALSGSWRCMGQGLSGAATLWLRTA
ncbi:MAG: hypothetical protein ACK4NW_02015 [Roseinatronobacter sp.]